MQIEYIPISQLTPNEKNPRKITVEQFEKLCRNIENDPLFFSMRPCLVNATANGLMVYAGNQRLQAAKKIGMIEVPCIVMPNVEEDVIKKRIILDNLHHGEHDFDLLASFYEVEELLDLGMLKHELGILEDVQLTGTDLATELNEDKETCDKCGQKIKSK